MHEEHSRSFIAPLGSDTNAASLAPVLTVPEVALELRCSKAHVHNLINGLVRGVAPLLAIPLGRRRIVRRETLEAWKKDSERRLG
jgi:hypothetical protein